MHVEPHRGQDLNLRPLGYENKNPYFRKFLPRRHFRSNCGSRKDFRRFTCYACFACFARNLLHFTTVRN